MSRYYIVDDFPSCHSRLNQGVMFELFQTIICYVLIFPHGGHHKIHPLILFKDCKWEELHAYLWCDSPFIRLYCGPQYIPPHIKIAWNLIVEGTYFCMKLSRTCHAHVGLMGNAYLIKKTKILTFINLHNWKSTRIFQNKQECKFWILLSNV